MSSKGDLLFEWSYIYDLTHNPAKSSQEAKISADTPLVSDVRKIQVEVSSFGQAVRSGLPKNQSWIPVSAGIPMQTQIQKCRNSHMYKPAHLRIRTRDTLWKISFNSPAMHITLPAYTAGIYPVTSSWYVFISPFPPGQERCHTMLVFW